MVDRQSGRGRPASAVKHTLRALRRATLTTLPADGDFIVNPTGFSWNIRRSRGDGTADSIAVGDRERTAAVARAIALAETASTDVWETVGTGEFWLLRCFRPPVAP